MADPSPPVPKRPGFLAGISEFFAGVAFVGKTPKVWPLALVPTAIALVIMVATSAVGLWGSGRASTWIVGEPTGTWATVAAVALRIVFGALALVVSVLLGMALAQPLSGWALEKLVRRVQLDLHEPIAQEEPLLPSMLRSVAVTAVGLLVSLPIVAILATIGFAFPPATVVTIPLKFIVGAVVIAWDFFDYPLGLYRVGVRERFRYFQKNFWSAFGLGCAAMTMLLIPCIGLFVLSWGVVGATRVTVAARRFDAEPLPARAI